MTEEPKETGLEFIRISHLSSGQHLSIPRAELREMGLTGGKDDYLAIFKYGGCLLLAPLRKNESIQDIEDEIRRTLANDAGYNRQEQKPVEDSERS